MKRDVKYNILSVEKKRQEAFRIEYEFNGILFESAIVLNDNKPFCGVKKYINMQSGEVKIEEMGEWERELIYSLAQDWEHYQETAV